ncbi:glycosyltransferase family 2 protein [Hydrotalea sp.]|uniref:glycosyltransferase family 2 protein n=1 Tax=Hydrotalea sp. TaxID=2881279 RepID=UPI003D0FDEB5
MNHSAEILFLPKNTNQKNNTFSIVIPSWNNLPYLKLCIESIRKNSTLSHQIIVFVNDGKDGTFEWAQSQTDIDVVYSSVNVGVCYALNACRKLLQTDYLLYMNDDMYVCPKWDTYLWEEIQLIGNKYFFISATAIEPVASSNCAIEYNFGTDITNFNEAALLEQFAQLPMNDWQGATWPPNIVHIDVWDLVGGYSIEFSPGMYSDPDFSMKLWQMGIRYFKGISKSRVYHFGSRSVKRVEKNPGYYTFINKWGMTSSTLSKFYLKRGEPFKGNLTEPNITFSLKIKNSLKRLLASFKRNNF